MIVNKIANGPLQVNTYILSDGNKSIIIDPGIDTKKIIDYLSVNNLTPNLIILTHTHYDHIEGVHEIKTRFNTELFFHKDDEELYFHNDNSGDNHIKKPPPTGYIKDNDIIKLVDTEIKVIHTPGHTKGSVCFYSYPYLFSGDTLFYGSIGRTDLPGGDFEQIIESIKNRLLNLQDDVIVYPGHMESTTILFERENNPYLQ